jgi:methyl-accepting chemotaxis protein
MKLFQRLRTKLILTMVITTLVPTVASSVLIFWVYRDTLQAQARMAYTENAKDLKSSVEAFLAPTKSDVLFLSQSVTLTDYLTLHNVLQTSIQQTNEDNTTPPGSQEAALQAAQNSLEQKRQLVEREFLAFLRNRSIYYQLVYLNETGQEIVRVISDGLKNKSIEPDKLQNLSDTELFKEATLLSGKQVFVSPLELYRNSRRLETPYKPVIHYIVNVSYDNGRKAGVVMATVDANQFLKLLGEVRLVNENGYFLNHPDSQRRWGGPTDLDTKYHLEREYPTPLAKQILGQEGNFITPQMTLFTQVIYVPGSSQHWTLIIQRNTSDVLSQWIVFRNLFGIVVGTALLVVFLFQLWWSVKVSRPFEQLIQQADAISKGEQMEKPISIKATGEIGQLVEAFERMRVSVVRSFDRLRKSS